MNGYKNDVKGVQSKIKTLYTSIDLATSKIDRAKSSSILIRQVMVKSWSIAGHTARNNL